MSVDTPTREELRRGMTVEIEQTNAENANEAEPLRGDIAKSSPRSTANPAA